MQRNAGTRSPRRWRRSAKRDKAPFRRAHGAQTAFRIEPPPIDLTMLAERAFDLPVVAILDQRQDLARRVGFVSEAGQSCCPEGRNISWRAGTQLQNIRPCSCNPWAAAKAYCWVAGYCCDWPIAINCCACALARSLSN